MAECGSVECAEAGVMWIGGVLEKSECTSEWRCAGVMSVRCVGAI